MKEIDFDKIIDAGKKKEKKPVPALQKEITETPKEPQKIVFDQKQLKAREFLKKEVSVAPVLPATESKIKRTKSGIIGLDKLIEGGFEKASSILVVGSAGTGKTTFGLQFLYYGAKDYSEPGIYISFEEDKNSLFTHASVFDWDLEGMEKKGLLKVLLYKPHQVEKLVKEGGGPIKDAIREMNAKRLVIDSITAYTMLFKDIYQKRESVLELFSYLEKWGCTSLIISELPPKLAEVKEGSIGFLTDAIISLYYAKRDNEGERVHSMEILKMRGTKHTDKLLVIQFEKQGIKLYPGIDVF